MTCLSRDNVGNTLLYHNGQIKANAMHDNRVQEHVLVPFLSMLHQLKKNEARSRAFFELARYESDVSAPLGQVTLTISGPYVPHEITALHH